MAGSFAWLDYSEHDRRRALDFVDQFRDRATRDELGIGTVRDALSDALFPGISTIQTRARYFLFVPWIYRDLEGDEVAAGDVARLARKAELDLIDTLAESEDIDGVIGIEARRTLKRLPSNIYWQGLFEWGVRRHPAPQAGYHRFFKAFSQAAQSRQRDGDDEEIATRALRPMWHTAIPGRPDDFPKVASFSLTGEEARYLQERILSRAGGTMLAFLVAVDRSIEASDFPWQYQRISSMPTSVRSQLEHARVFALVMHGAALVYNALIARAQAKSELVDDFHARLLEWSHEMVALGSELSAWNLTDFWREISRQNNRIGRPTRAFVNRWIELAASGRVIGSAGIADDAAQLVAARERALKGTQSRLLNQRAMELWNGEAGTGVMAYRWNRVLSIVRDIQEGLGHA